MMHYYLAIRPWTPKQAHTALPRTEQLFTALSQG